MKLSTKCRYGVRAMLEIGRQYTHEGTPVKRKDISKAQDISHGYLENILIALKSHKLIRTTRGANGGFILEKSPDKITLLDLVLALEGSIAPVDCIENKTVCAKSGFCVARLAWEKLHIAQTTTLAAISLQDLLDAEKAEQKSFDFAI